jgi:hypothetical protein
VCPRWSHVGRSCAGDRWKMFSTPARYAEPVHPAYNPSFSACLNNIFLSQQISQPCFFSRLISPSKRDRNHHADHAVAPELLLGAADGRCVLSTNEPAVLIPRTLLPGTVLNLHSSTPLGVPVWPSAERQQNRWPIREPSSDRAREWWWFEHAGPGAAHGERHDATAPTTFNRPERTPFCPFSLGPHPARRPDHSPRAHRCQLLQLAPLPCPNTAGAACSRLPTPPRAVDLPPPHRHCGPASGGPTCQRLLICARAWA